MQIPITTPRASRDVGHQCINHSPALCIVASETLRVVAYI